MNDPMFTHAVRFANDVIPFAMRAMLSSADIFPQPTHVLVAVNNNAILGARVFFQKCVVWVRFGDMAITKDDSEEVRAEQTPATSIFYTFMLTKAGVLIDDDPDIW